MKYYVYHYCAEWHLELGGTMGVEGLHTMAKPVVTDGRLKQLREGVKEKLNDNGYEPRRGFRITSLSFLHEIDHDSSSLVTGRDVK